MAFKNPIRPLKRLVRAALNPRAMRLLADDAFALASHERLRPSLDGKSVALVGNAQALLTSGAGTAIDAHQCIIRFNRGFVSAPAHQGRRTDLVAISASMKPDEIFDGFPGATIVWASARRNLMRTGFLRRIDDLAIVPLADHAALSALLGGAPPSSGMLLLWLVRTRFSPTAVTLYGFDWKKTPTFYTHLMGAHDWAAEAALIAKWQAEDSRLTIVDPGVPFAVSGG